MYRFIQTVNIYLTYNITKKINSIIKFIGFYILP